MLLGEDEFFGEGKSDKIPDLYDGNVPPKKNRLPSHCARWSSYFVGWHSAYLPNNLVKRLRYFFLARQNEGKKERIYDSCAREIKIRLENMKVTASHFSCVRARAEIGSRKTQ